MPSADRPRWWPTYSSRLDAQGRGAACDCSEPYPTRWGKWLAATVPYTPNVAPDVPQIPLCSRCRGKAV